METPNVHYGTTVEQKPEWKTLGEKFDDIDDDEPMPVSPISVVKMLGFDPLDLEGGDEIPAAEREAEMRATDADDPGVGALDVHGIPIIIETRKGDVRNGPGFEVAMPAHYGYIDGVMGADGDSLDCYVGDNRDSDWVYVIDQRHVPPKKGFDEHKCMIGFSSQGDALRAYDAGHHRAREVFMDWTPMRIDDFKTWMRGNDLKKPCGDVKA
jgi:hypothetical protein